MFVETIDYTCDKNGYDIYKCSRCEATENKNFTDAACRPESDYTVIEKASCDRAGYKAILCSVCKEELETETIAKREHNIVDTTVATKATCITEGVMNQKCDCAASDEYVVCTYTTTRVIPVDAENHKSADTEIKHIKVATCTEEGYTGDECYVCCGEVKVAGAKTEKVAHTEKIIPAVEPDCVNEGLTEGVECLLCGETLVEQETVAALGHIFTVVSAVYDENNVGTIVYECIDCGYEKTEEVDFNVADTFKLIDEADKKLLSDKLTDAEREKIEVALAEFESFIENYVVLDEEGNVIENNLPLDNNATMTEYHILLNNLENAINGRTQDDIEKSCMDMIFDYIDLIATIFTLLYKLIMLIKAY